MTTSTTSILKRATKETVGGGYFVANYPPFSFWTHDHLPALVDAMDHPPSPDTPLGLYVHIPFCRKRCHFCYFKVYTDVNAKTIWDYVHAVTDELKLYRDKPFIGDRKLNYVYFGGGTPSYLSVEQLSALKAGIEEVLPMDSADEITFEAEPGTLNEPRLQAIHELGVTRLSLGVENFDDHILEVNGRAHRSKGVYRVYDFARRIDFPQINIDLIAGMLDETDDNWKRCVDETLKLAPDSVTIYQMEVPFNTTIFKQMKESGQFTAPVADWETKRAWVKYAFEKLEDAGYEIASGYTAVRKDKNIRFVYRDQLWRGADMLALGVASFGHINGVHFQNIPDIVPYKATVGEGRLPVARALPTTHDEKLIREFILQMKLGHVSKDYFTEKFGTDVQSRFAEPIAFLKDRGYIQEKTGDYTLSRDGLMCVDAFLPEFFQPRHRHVLYPLNEFFESDGRELPSARELPPEKLPDPQRALLCHDRDMTTTLESHHGGKIHVDAQAVVESKGTHAREVLLRLDESDRAVECGAIKIHLDDLAGPAKQLILDNKEPLGRILNEHGIAFESRPILYFRIMPNEDIRRILDAAPGKALYGRRNVLAHPDGNIIAEIVEILPEA